MVKSMTIENDFTIPSVVFRLICKGVFKLSIKSQIGLTHPMPGVTIIKDSETEWKEDIL